MAIVGLSIPFMRPNTNNAEAAAAPVFPADTTASQSPSFTKRVATTIEEVLKKFSVQNLF